MAETEVVSFLREVSGEQFDVAVWTREEPDPALRGRIVAYVQQAVGQRLLDRAK